MIILHFHLQPQFKMNYFIYFSSSHCFVARKYFATRYLLGWLLDCPGTSPPNQDLRGVASYLRYLLAGSLYVGHPPSSLSFPPPILSSFSFLSTSLRLLSSSHSLFSVSLLSTSSCLSFFHFFSTPFLFPFSLFLLRFQFLTSLGVEYITGCLLLNPWGFK